jgi:HD superfamily phosphodiesterase
MRPYKREKFTTMVMVTAFGLSALGFSNSALAATVGKMHDIGPGKTTFIEGNASTVSYKTRKKHATKKARTAEKHIRKVKDAPATTTTQ